MHLPQSFRRFFVKAGPLLITIVFASVPIAIIGTGWIDKESQETQSLLKGEKTFAADTQLPAPLALVSPPGGPSLGEPLIDAVALTGELLGKAFSPDLVRYKTVRGRSGVPITASLINKVLSESDDERKARVLGNQLFMAVGSAPYDPDGWLGVAALYAKFGKWDYAHRAAFLAWAMSDRSDHIRKRLISCANGEITSPIDNMIHGVVPEIVQACLMAVNQPGFGKAAPAL